MELFFNILWLMMDLVTAFLLCYAFLPPKAGSMRFLLLIPTAIVALLCGCIWNAPSVYESLWAIPSPWEVVLALAVVLFGMRLLFDGKWYRCLWIFAVFLFTSTAVHFILLERASARSLTDLVEFFWAYGEQYAMTVTIGKLIIFFLVWMLLGFRKRKSGRHMLLSWILLSIPLPTAFFLLTLDSYGHLFFPMAISNLDNAQLLIAVVSMVILAAANGVVLYLFHVSQRSARKSEEMRLLQQQMEIQTENILALEKSYRAQRAASHEFSHHLNTIHTLLGCGQYDALAQYVSELQENQTTRIFSINSHHPIIDAVVNQKYQEATENGIDMQVRVNDLSGLSLPTEALVVLLSNLLDNSIEACVCCDGERFIHLSLILDQGVLLTIENTSNPVTVVNGDIISSKTDCCRHGYGLQNVRMILDTLRAEYTFRYKSGIFRFAAEIPTESRK